MTARARLLGVSLAVLLVALTLTFGELDRLVSQVGGGFRFSISDVTGLSAMSHLDQWYIGGSTDPAAWRVQPFIVIYTVLDVVYMGLYGLAGWLIINRVFPAAGRLAPRMVLILLLVVDVVEDVLLNVAGASAQSTETSPSYPLIQAQAGVSVVKWLVLLLLAIVVLRRPSLLRDIWTVLKRILIALYVQRLSTFLVIVLAVLSLLSLHPILEQVPDIQRGWLDADKAWGGFAATAVLFGLAVIFWFIGRAMAERYAGQRGSTTGPNYVLWLAIPAVVFVGGSAAISVWYSARVALVDLAPFKTFLMVTIGVLAASAVFEAIALLIGRYRGSSAQGAAAAPHQEAVSSIADLADARRAAAVLSALIIALPALGFARSLSTQVLLAIAAPRPAGEEGGALWSQTIPADKVTVSAVVIVILLTIAIGVLFLATGPLARADATPATPMTESPGWRIGAGAMAIVLIGGVVATVMIPSWIGEHFGAIAVAIGAIGAWTALVGLLSLVLSFHAPLQVFRWVGLKSDPVIALFLVVPLLVAQFGGTQTLHRIDRLPDQSPLADRDTLSEAFDEWRDRSGGCLAEVENDEGGTETIRPLLLVAAEGGGIRAAVWTVAAMSELVSAGGCVSNSVFLSSGVSGGSVGLAIAANPNWDPADLEDADQLAAEQMAQQLRNAVHAIGDSTALATGIGGLLINDPIASTTGIRLPSLESSWRWRDRASLIEHSWRAAYPGFKEAFDADIAAPTGAVVLNSTDIRSGCRVVVSQVELGPGETGLTAPPEEFTRSVTTAECSEGAQEPALTIDMLDFFEQCEGPETDWATAALLSARFPFVTPSGTIGNGQCGPPRLQLVDGGYAENSGLGLLADTAPSIGQLIRDYNTLQREDGDPLVVPYVMYVQNSPEAITEPLGIRDTAEILVPLVGAGANATQVAPSSWIQRIMASIGELCGVITDADPDDTGDTAERLRRCAASADAVEWNAEVTRRVVIMQAETQPSISVPLGWGLSDASYCQLVLDADQQAGVGSMRPFEFNNTLRNYLVLFPDNLSGGSNQDERCRID